MMRGVMMIVVVLLAFAGAASANLLLNPSFETQDGASSWLAQDWWRTTGPDLADRANWYPNSGSFHMSFKDYAAGTGTFGQYLTTGIALNDTLAFSIFGDAGSAFVADDVQLGIEYYYGAGVITNYASIYSGLTGQAGSGYHQYTFVSTASVAGIYAVSAFVQVQNRTVASPNGQLFFDDASLTVIPEPTAVALLGLGGLLMVAVRRKTSK